MPLLRKFTLSYTFFVSLIFTLLISSYSFSQSVDDLTDEQVIQFMNQVQSSGLTEDQIAVLAAEKGYSLSDISKMKERMSKIQVKKNIQPTQKITNERSLNDTILTKSVEQVKKEELSATKRDKIFGLNTFQNNKLSFEPNLRIPTPKNYILGVDDELSITITGFAYKNYTTKISPEGTIQIENLSPIFVNGLTIEQAKERIINRLKTLFGGLSMNGGGLSADITLGNIRSIKVTVIGEAVQPGTYTVPSLATVFNILYACGGPSEIGSLRKIEIFRGGKIIKTLDYYDFLLRGDQKDNILLHDQDIVRIPYVDARVSLHGEFRNPKIFEINKGETLQDVISYAGGFNEFAYSKSITLRRTTDVEFQIKSIKKDEFRTFVPQKGDVYEADSLTIKYENLVVLKGAVYRPGDYELVPNMTLVQLINKAEGLKDDAFKKRIIIKRQRDNLDSETISVDLEKVLANQVEDIQLKKQDTVFVRALKDLRERRTVQIEGAVNKPGLYEYTDNLTISEVVTLAGGFTDGAEPSKIEVARRIKEDTLGLSPEQSIKILDAKVDKSLGGIDKEDFVLNPFDRIYVRRLSRYEEQKNVSITGEIFYPGPYALKDKTEKVSDLIRKAGGLKSEADLGGAKFSRAGKVIGIDLTKIKDQPDDPNNLLLNAGDVLEIPRKKGTVTINGEVYNPLTVPFQSTLTLKDYINLAGGTNDSAYVKKIYVRYANGNLDRTRNFFGVKIFPKIENGSEIYVPVKRRSKWTPAERIAVSSALVSIATILVTIIRVGTGG